MNSLVGLSIGQPWIDMILQGAKSMEIRSWDVKRRGAIALHASWQVDFPISYFYGYETPWALPRGRILAVAEITKVVLLDEIAWQDCLQEHRQPLPFSGGCYGICLSNVRSLGPGVRCRGRPGFFPLPEDVLKKVTSLNCPKGILGPEEFYSSPADADNTG
jgi:hypothetical protein